MKSLVLISVCTLLSILPGFSAAQTTISSGNNFDDPRMMELRSRLLKNFGGVRELTFTVKTNKSLEFDESRKARSAMRRFVLKLGGQPVEKNGQFSIGIFKQGKTCTFDGCEEIIEALIWDSANKNSGAIASNTITLNCGRSTAHYHNGYRSNYRASYCVKSFSNLEEILLSMGVN